MNNDSDYHARWERWYYEAIDREFWDDLCKRLDDEEAERDGLKMTDEELEDMARAYEELERDQRNGNV